MTLHHLHLIHAREDGKKESVSDANEIIKEAKKDKYACLYEQAEYCLGNCSNYQECIAQMEGT